MVEMALYQSFEEVCEAAETPARLAALRARLEVEGVGGFLIPRADEFQGEYVPPSAERLAWATGFTGSAGTALILRERAVLLVDGRYTLQARQQVLPELFEVIHLGDEPLTRWLERALPRGLRLGVDPWLHTVDGLAALGQAASRAGAEIVSLGVNPIDVLWQDRPRPPASPIEPHSDALSGRPSSEKRREIAEAVARAGADAFILADTPGTAWLLNIRGRDVPHTPVILAFGILGTDGRVTLFADPARASPSTRHHLGQDVTLAPPDAFAEALTRLGTEKKRVLLATGATAAAIRDHLAVAGAAIVAGADPCQLPKARKTRAEIAGAEAAHHRDGAALSRFLAWLDAEAPGGTVDEIGAAIRLESFRRETNQLRDISFDTIAGAGPNGAIVHYRPSRASNRRLGPGELFLIDSGGQYPDGTTDVTRTVAIGTPSPEMADRYTRVLKGHIAVATCRFPKGTTGAQLDGMARRALWEAGLDYDHGTGHGVGSFLSVHEGPQGISKRYATPLEEGMIVSNEPGYYKEGAYGIRIENLLVVTEPEIPPGGERPMHGFAELTLAPIDRRLIVAGLLNAAERQWLDRYHARVMREIGPLVDEATRAWLARATAPI